MPLSEEAIQQTVLLKLQLQGITHRMSTVAADALRIEADPNRSPSPPPRYDSAGKRSNTREVRMREALNSERSAIIESLLRLNPTFVPPADFVRAKPTKKVYIPRHIDPNYNYIGLIIGPRGNTQRKMEADTNCKISIRGKGSAKEGSKGRGQKTADDDDDLHVHISGDNEDNVAKAAAMIEQLLRPVEDHLNEHKQKQLRELALINGTLREEEYCPVCGEKGHRQFECPYRAKAFKSAGVKCSICGDLSHPTRDCPLKQDGGHVHNLDTEYDSFLAELDGAPPRTSSSATVHTADTPSGADESSRPAVGRGPTILAPIVDMFSNKPPSALPVQPLGTHSIVLPLSSVPIPPGSLPMPMPGMPYMFPPPYFGYAPAAGPGSGYAPPPPPSSSAPPPPPPPEG